MRGSSLAGAFAASEPPPRLRLVETSSHTSSSPTWTSVSSENCFPRGWSSTGVADTSIWSRSDPRIGRCWVIRLAMCTSPIARNGKLGSVISDRCSGNASMCGYVGGRTSRSANPQTRS